RLRLPRRDRLIGEPDRQAATLAETGLIRRPIRDLVPLPRDVVTAILVQLERHGTSGAQKKGPSPTRDQPLAPQAHPCTTLAWETILMPIDRLGPEHTKELYALI